MAVAQRIDDARLVRRRTLGDWFVVCFPPLYRRIAQVALERLPPTSRLRQAVTRSQLVSGWAAVSRGDFRLLAVRYARDIDYQMTRELVTLGARERSLGRAEWMASIREFLDSWQDWRFAPAVVIATDLRLISLGRFTAHGKASQVGTEIDFAQVMDFERGLVSRERDFADWSQALTAGGIDPSALERLESLAPGESLEI